jgi:hypothetical protein
MRNKGQALSRFRAIASRWPFGLFVMGCVALVAAVAFISLPAALFVAGAILVTAGIVEVLT